MRLLRPLVGALALACLAGAARPAQAETLTDVAKRLAELRKRVNLWSHLLQQDPDRDTIVLYLAQTEEDFKKKDNERITAAQLVKIIADRNKQDRSIRSQAGKALQEATMKGVDPDLKPRIKRGMPSKRAEFALKHLIPWLSEPDKKDGNRWTRLIVQDVLKSWFAASGGNQAAIALYDVDNENTWKKAEQAWRDVVKDS
jgi:hypothetical protein